MAERRILDTFRIKSRFLRSARLDRDFHDPNALSGYVRTDFIQDASERITDGLRPQSGHRAWRVTGDYGSGKSSFALLLANVLGRPEADLPPQLRRVVDFRKLGVPRSKFLPVLVTCAREPLGTSILRGLEQAVSTAYGRSARAKATEPIRRLLTANAEPNDNRVVDAILECNARVIADSKADGLLLIIDELGKFLEFAALNPHRQDIFLLQLLAEAASRSGNEPLFLICLLHQGFHAYADQLDQSAQREWEKIAGRFQEIVFDQPLDQLGHLIASALNIRTDLIPKAQAAALRQAMRQTIDLGWFPAAQRQSLVDLAPRLYPLHPTVLPVLIRIFRRFGQNERSLFSFLLANEPFGLRSFAEEPINGAQPYRLHNLFDYVRTSFGHRLAIHSCRSHWNLIESVVESYATDDPLRIQVLKTVGILNLLNDDLLATQESVACALSGDNPALRRPVRIALDKLHRVKRALYDRGRFRGLCLWPHTSVDLEQAYEDARRAVHTPQRVAPLIQDLLETRPVVARRHYIETGNLRHYDVRHCPVAELPALLNTAPTDADGLIILPLCETPSEREAALAFARSPELKSRDNWLVAVSQPLNNLAGLVQEAQRWEWIAANTPQLNADKFGRDEVSARLRRARKDLERRARTLIGFKQFARHADLAWFNRATPLRIEDGRRLLSELSRILDETYSQAPRIHNELVNRRNLSAASAAARMRLIERMIASSAAPSLGMQPERSPPEMSIYLSVLRNTGIHRLCDGRWSIREPDPSLDERCRVLPAPRKMSAVLDQKPNAQVNVATLFEQLREPPFGIRDGLLPILLTAFAIAHHRTVAFYKDGAFIRELTGESMLVLSKHPDRFEIQHCRTKGVQSDLIRELGSVIGHDDRTDGRVELLDVARSLCVLVAQLPPYVHQTKRLSQTTSTVRDLILNAREPARLVFIDLPEAFGLRPFQSRAFAGRDVSSFVWSLSNAVDELKAAFPRLHHRLERALRDTFDLPGRFRQFRTLLAARAEQVILGASEPSLRAFCLRLMDDNLPEEEWVESLGSLLALKPPANWQDADEDAFAQELGRLASSFHRIEGRVFDRAIPPANSVGVRLTITLDTGFEREQVVHYAPDEAPRVRGLQAKFESILAQHDRLGMSALSRAVWTALEAGEHSDS